MSTETPTILKKILARKREEIIEHSAITPQSMLVEKLIRPLHQEVSPKLLLIRLLRAMLQ